MTDLLDIPEFLRLDTAERIAAQRARLAALPVGPSVGALGRGKSLTGLTPLSSAAGRRALELVAMVRLEPRSRAELLEMMAWHPGELGRGLKLAEEHGLIRLEDGVYRATGTSSSASAIAGVDFAAYRHPVLVVPCPLHGCGAPAGAWCRRPSEHRAMTFHKERRLAADRVWLEQGAPFIERTADRFVMREPRNEEERNTLAASIAAAKAELGL